MFPDLSEPRTRGLLAAALGACVVMAGWSALDGVARHGWSAGWYTQVEGERTLLTETVEHRVAFPNQHRAFARYVQGWDFSVAPMPEAAPHLDASLAARLHVPPGSGRVLQARTSDHVIVRVDGLGLEDDDVVSPGWHRLEVDWEGSFGPRTGLTLLWGRPDQPLEEVPAHALVPLEGSWPATRVALWLVGALFMLLFCGSLYRVASAEGLARRRHVWALAAGLVILLGTGYRLIDYDVMPAWGENDDERFAMWNGFSLLHDGSTRGLTMWGAEYRGHSDVYEAHYMGRTYVMVTPYFEHPPLLHVLVGAAGVLGGAQDYLEVSLRHARLVPITLAALTMLLMLAIGRRLDPDRASPILGTLLYAAIPWIALQTRVVKEEALLTPLALGSLLCFLEWRTRWRASGPSGAARWLAAAGVLAGLAPCTKVTGAAFILSLLVLVAAEGSKRDFGVALASSVGAAALLPLYGALIDWDAFVFTQGLQTGRPVHWNIFLRFFSSPLINHNLVGRGWLLFLWLAALPALLTRERRNTSVLAVPLVCYLAAIALGSGTWTFGWYVTPMLPYLCLAAGRYLEELWRRPDLLRGGLVVMVLLFYSLNFTLDVDEAKQAAHWPEIRRAVTLALFLGLAPFALAQAFPRSPAAKGAARVGMAATLALVVALGAVFIARYDVYAESYAAFDRDDYFDR